MFVTKSHKHYFCFMDIQKFLEQGAEYFLPNLSVDIIIIGYQDQELKCLLLQIGDKWLLPGGYVGLGEAVDQAAVRILKERAGLDDPHLSFLSVFGDSNRNFSGEWKEFFEQTGLPWRDDYWLNSRFVTLAYYSLVNMEHTHPVVREYDQAVSWFSFDELPAMWMDHQTIVLEARNRLKEDIKKELVTYNLLPDPFTMPELHQLHETILEEKLDRSRFQKKMLSSGIFERLPKRKNVSPGRNPYQYKVKTEKLNSGFPRNAPS